MKRLTERDERYISHRRWGYYLWWQERELMEAASRRLSSIAYLSAYERGRLDRLTVEKDNEAQADPTTSA